MALHDPIGGGARMTLQNQSVQIERAHSLHARVLVDRFRKTTAPVFVMSLWFGLAHLMCSCVFATSCLRCVIFVRCAA